MALTKVSTNMLAANAIQLGTQTTGNYIQTLADAGSSRITVANSGAESAAVTLDIASDAIGADQLAASAVVTDSIVDDAITAAKIADDAIVAAAIADNAVDIARLNVTDGSSGQALVTDGSGTLSFATVGGLYNAWLVKTAAYTMLSGDQIVGNHASTAFTLTLPSSPSAGAVVTVKNVGSALITIGRNSQPINSSANDALLPQNNAATLVYVDSTIGWTTI